jgi:quercetin dioxygenase-like cupin family protein
MSFNPNKMTFADGLKRIEKALATAEVKIKSRIITSRDADVGKAVQALEVSNVPAGFRKWQLPISLDKPSQMFLTTAAPGAEVGLHSHDEGDGVRFIVSGSIIYDGKELTAGDWMFIPKGEKYSMRVGHLGAVMAYCYSCCCA